MDERDDVTDLKRRAREVGEGLKFWAPAEIAANLRASVAEHYGVSPEDVRVEVEAGEIKATVRQPPQDKVTIDVIAVPVGRAEG